MFFVFTVALFYPVARARAEFFCEGFIEALDLSEFAGFALGNLFEGSESFSGEEVRDHIIDIEGFSEELGSLHHFFLSSGTFVSFGEEFYLPTCEVCCEIDALSFSSDGEGELVFWDDDFHSVAVFIEDDF